MVNKATKPTDALIGHDAWNIQLDKNGNLKHILKKSVRGLIPDELIDRKKQGFGVPIHEWFLDRLGEQTQKEIKGNSNFPIQKIEP